MKTRHLARNFSAKFIIVLFILLTGCNCEVEISEIKFPPPGKKIWVGEEIDLTVDVENIGNCSVDYQWNASNGVLSPASGLPKTRYKAPCEPGDYRIIFEARTQRRKTETRYIDVEVRKLNPLSIFMEYSPSGWMGDRRSISSKQTTHNEKPCYEFTYRPIGQEGWGGIKWQFPPNNWGSQLGKNLTGYKKVVFWACSKNNAKVNFMVGGTKDPNLTYRDSFQKETGFIDLKTDWTKYTISLEEEDISNVISAFTWVSNRDNNSSDITFYIADVSYETDPCE
jgi:hypothetical protein